MNDLFPFKIPIKSYDELSPFYKDYVLKVSGENDLSRVPIEDANGLFQMIQDSADVTFSYDKVKK